MVRFAFIFYVYCAKLSIPIAFERLIGNCTVLLLAKVIIQGYLGTQ